MINYIEYLGVPEKLAICVVIIFFVIQGVGEFLEFRGKIVPEIMKVRKYFKRRKREREILNNMPNTMSEVRELLNDVRSHYNADNITKRDDWIKSVNKRLKQNEELSKALGEKIDHNNEITLSILLDSKRNTIISFAQRVIDEKSLFTREEFNRVLKLYDEYEDIIEKHGLTNGEIDIAYKIITQSYEDHMRNHSFLEDIRGYGL